MQRIVSAGLKPVMEARTLDLILPEVGEKGHPGAAWASWARFPASRPIAPAEAAEQGLYECAAVGRSGERAGKVIELPVIHALPPCPNRRHVGDCVIAMPKVYVHMRRSQPFGKSARWRVREEQRAEVVRQRSRHDAEREQNAIGPGVLCRDGEESMGACDAPLQ